MLNFHRSLASVALTVTGILLFPLGEAQVRTQIGTSIGTSIGINNWHQANAVEPETVILRFQVKVGDQPFGCAQTYRLGKSATPVVPMDFRFYVSQVALIDAKGNAVPLSLKQEGRWQYENLALLDFEDKSGNCANGTVEMNDRIVGTVPAGNYTGLRFTVGVPFKLNHVDATLAPSPLNLTSLWWNWQSGYKFARIDLNPQAQVGMVPMGSPVNQHSPVSQHSPASQHSGSSPVSSPASSPGHSSGHSADAQLHATKPGFAIHLGSTGCELTSGSPTPDHCSYPNTTTITLNHFDPTENVVIADLATLLANTDLGTNQPNTAPGCMSQPNDSDCAGIMSALGIPFQSTTAPTQTFFRVE